MVTWGQLHPERVRELHRDFVRRHLHKRIQYNKEQRRLQPDKYHARDAIANAIRAGYIVKPLYCTRCQKDCRVEAHHSDYSKPLDIEWLCTKCHRIVDAERIIVR